MAKMNCWEYKNCGREESGRNVEELGVCEATKEARLDGVHGGTNAGRACWSVKHTLCGGKKQSNLAVKLSQCVFCDFYKLVSSEEQGFMSTSSLRDMLKDTEKSVK
jgi:hypothetical protein